MPAFRDLTGQRFGRLVAQYCVVRSSRKGCRQSIWRCQCDCGNSKDVRGVHLVRGLSQSCGCLQKEIASNANTVHGLSHTRLYNIYTLMVERCNNPLDVNYQNYGGRGIKVCKDWLNDRASFFEWAIKNGYSDQLTIDRKDNNAGYCPDNCRWATRKEQNRNKRNNILLTVNGKTQVLSDWARETGIDRKTLSHRVESGWNIADAVSIPPVIGRNQFSERSINNGTV